MKNSAIGAGLPDSLSVSQDEPRPSPPSREEVARVINPFAVDTSFDPEGRRNALAAADRVLSLFTPREGGGEGSSCTDSTDARRFAAAEEAQRKSEGGAG